jgi:hypothetical protein
MVDAFKGDRPFATFAIDARDAYEPIDVLITSWKRSFNLRFGR